MEKPVLVVMAAGMGSRYGGLKQMDPIGPHGQSILDYSVYDAKRAGFETVIFVIKKEMEEDFRQTVGARIEKGMNVLYAFQDITDLPDGYSVPEGRTKPWGTAHAVLAARELVKGPFAVINADDCYGPAAYDIVYRYLTDPANVESDKPRFVMPGYLIENTVTESGSVSRGICQADENGNLSEIIERTRIVQFEDGIRFTEDGETWVDLANDAIASMNIWGFTHAYMEEAERRFPDFLDRALATNPLKGEYYLPFVVSEMIKDDQATVRVIPTPDKWYGVTYREDKPGVMAALAQKTKEGIYKENLWE